MSVNIYDGTNLTPIAGKTVPVPTPDYVDIQYNPSTTWTTGMTCISGNKRYKCKANNTGSQYAPPNTTYWEELSVAYELNKKKIVKLATIDKTGTSTSNISVNLPTGYSISDFDFIVGQKKTTPSSGGKYRSYPGGTAICTVSEFKNSDSSYCELLQTGDGAWMSYYYRNETSIYALNQSSSLSIVIYGVKV